MAKDRSQPPYTPEQARARSKAGPKPTSYKAGSTDRGYAGSTKMAKRVRRPGIARDTGPGHGRNG